MRIPQIQISITDIKMDLTINEGQQHISQPNADLNISQPAAILNISTTGPKMEVDMSQFWRDVDQKPIGEVITDYVNKGRQGALRSISKAMNEGRQMMMNAGKGQAGQAIQSIAKQNYGPKVQRIGLDFTPSYQAIKVDIQPGTTDVQIQAQKPKIDVQVNKPSHDYTLGDVNGTMITRPRVDVSVNR